MSDIYALVVGSRQGKTMPKGFRIADKCCIKCLQCDDEMLTICIKHDVEVEWHDLCDSFEECKTCLSQS